MPKSYAQLVKQIDALRHEAESVRRKEVAGVVKRIKDAIAAYGLTAADLGLAGAAGKGRRASAKSGKPKAMVGKVKYRDAAGHAWSGKGPRPGWLKAALASGKTLDDLTV